MRLKKSYQLKALVTKLKAIECAKLVWAFAKVTRPTYPHITKIIHRPLAQHTKTKLHFSHRDVRGVCGECMQHSVCVCACVCVCV